MVVFKLQFFKGYHTYMWKNAFTTLSNQVKLFQMTSKLYPIVTKYIIFKYLKRNTTIGQAVSKLSFFISRCVVYICIKISLSSALKSFKIASNDIQFRSAR